MFLQEGDFVPYTNGGMSEERTMKIIRKKKDVLFDMVVSTFFKKAERLSCTFAKSLSCI